MTTRTWQLGSRADDSAEAWNEVARGINVDAAMLVRVRQVHGVAVVVARAGQMPAREQRTADIMVSNHPAVALAMQTADCVPLLMADRRRGAVALAHAGWRGLAANLPRVAVEALTRQFGSRPADLIAAAGPSVGPCCYEVGADVRDRFDTAGFSDAHLARWFHVGPQPTPFNPSMPGVPPTPRPAHWFFDVWTSARDQLEAAGVPPDQIYVAQLCTASHSDAFCSYRRDRKVVGRIAGAIRCRG